MTSTVKSPMTSDQRLALRMMADKNIGAIVTRFGWTWPHDVRESEDKACAVVTAMLKMEEAAHV